ncbi:biopolymer transport protein ExbB [Hyphomonas adhaerens MHS-3]|uniref:Biopolymer transport protein ExbB n=1 Tax=Hyphomonas adhaerens MHS-3 TaxID=1280949 RepID=A0A069E013_9PROT|nr:MotA/TolQ/ExbB proton channel family protein [Hyphomonas adhaerens]KCZ82589.1 biopolymer transport protein ExbB [Hyphomonas adhaerens MHS-3]
MSDFLTVLMQPAGIVLVPLFACSVIALALIADRAVALASLKGLGQQAEQAVRRTATEKGAAAALAEVQAAHPFYEAAAEVLKDNLHADKHLREEAASLELQAAGRGLSRRLTGLTTIAGLAPLLGLLGTVIGLMVAFQALEGTSGPVEPGIVAGGLWQAMITTVIGLVIAVPCLVCHAWFRSRIRYRMADAVALLTTLSLAADMQEDRP